MALIDDVLEVIKDPDYKFSVSRIALRELIRGTYRGGRVLCPIIALCHKRIPGTEPSNCDYVNAAKRMGYSAEEAIAVAHAADYDVLTLKSLSHSEAVRYRRRMLAAIGEENES